MDQCAPQVAGAVVDLVNRLGVPWEYPTEQTCCGQFALTLGDPATAWRLMRHFLRVFEGADVILCPSASCTYTVRHHYPELAQDAGERRAATELASRVLELSEWLAHREPLPWTPRYNGSLVLHRSCKARQLGALDGVARLLSQVPGLELLTVSPYYSCCGFGGSFKVQQPQLSRQIGEAYLAAVRATGAAGMVSLDYICLLHLRALADGRAGDLRFFHLAEILAP